MSTHHHTTRIAVTAALGLLGAALARQLRRPADQRTWRGRVLGAPYDLRRPNLRREVATLWAPAEPRLVVPRAFGVGWTINLARLAHR